MRRVPSSLNPFEPRGRRTIAAIVLTFVLVATGSAALSIWAISRSKNRAAVLEIAARQRTLAERYVEELLLARGGNTADPRGVGNLLVRSAGVLLDGGTAPAAPGDDDAAKLPATTDQVVRAQLRQEQRLAHDLTAVGSAYLAGRAPASVPLTAHERITTPSPRERIRILAALTSNVALNTARTIASQTDHNITNAIMLQIGLGSGGILASLLLAWGLIATTRRQSAHFRSLVTSSTDLVLVLDDHGCRYASPSVSAALARAEGDLLNGGFRKVVHEDDWDAVTGLQAGGTSRLTFRVRNATGEWRHLDANVTDLRKDRHLHGIVLNARDITERVRLEQELTRQAQRDTFGAQLVEAFEMADEESAAHEVVERAMVEIAADAPMELLLSDSSRAHLERAAEHPSLGAPGCPVESPFACVAVRRGNPVVFESSEALNACPKLRNRPGGACSAVCVPISFMGRSLGVLHATGPDGAPLRADQVAQLTTLAGQAGTRI